MKRMIVLALAATLAGCPGETPKTTAKAAPDPAAKGVAAVTASIDKTKLKASLMAVLNAAKAHRAETGKVPKDASVLLKAELLKKEQAIDPWGNPYVIEAKGSKITVISYGADKQPGGTGPDTDWSSDGL